MPSKKTSLLQCFGLKNRAPSTGGLSADDLHEMLKCTKRNNEALKTEIHRLEHELEEIASSRSTKNRFSGWVEFLKSDQSKQWYNAWALLENGRLQFYREESKRSTKLADVDLTSREWKLHFRRKAYSSDSYAVSEDDLAHIIVLNILNDRSPDRFYHLYINTGSEAAKNAWMRALELEICSDAPDH